MTGTDVIKEIMHSEDISQTQLAKLAGYKAQTNITGILNRGTTLKVSSLDRMLRALGYKIQIVPINKETPKFSYEIQEENNE